MDVKLKLKRNTERSDKVLFGVAATTTSILALCAAILSYSALRELAVEAGFSEGLSYLFPITLDGLIISGSAMTLFAADRGERSYGGIALTALGVIASIIGNIAVSDQTLLARSVHAVPPLVLFLSLEGLTSLMRRRINESIARDELLLEESYSEHTSTPLSSPKNEVASTPKKADSPRLTMPREKSATIYPAAEPKTVSANNTEAIPSETSPEEGALPTNGMHSTESPNNRLSIPEQARQLINEHPHAEVIEIANMIEGKDKKYIRRVVRAEIKSRESTLVND